MDFNVFHVRGAEFLQNVGAQKKDGHAVPCHILATREGRDLKNVVHFACCTSFGRQIRPLELDSGIGENSKRNHSNWKMMMVIIPKKIRIIGWVIPSDRS